MPAKRQQAVQHAACGDTCCLLWKHTPFVPIGNMLAGVDFVRGYGHLPSTTGVCLPGCLGLAHLESAFLPVLEPPLIRGDPPGSPLIAGGPVAFCNLKILFSEPPCEVSWQSYVL